MSVRTDEKFCRSGKLASDSGLVSGSLINSPRPTVSQGPKSNVQPDPINQPGNLSNGRAFTSESVDFPSLVRHIEPQQWINPASMDWDQWDLIVDSLSTTS